MGKWKNIKQSLLGMLQALKGQRRKCEVRSAKYEANSQKEVRGTNCEVGSK